MTRRGTKPPAVYLDVDGVVTTEAHQEVEGPGALDHAAVALVAWIVRETGARVVVSSTWRVDDCRPALVEAGLPAGCFHPDWRTRIGPGAVDPATGRMLPAELAHRGEEISEHARRNGVTRLLVVDDVDAGPNHRGRQVRPDPAVGLTAAGAAEGIAILRRVPEGA